MSLIHRLLPFWYASLLAPASRSEALGVKTHKVENARQVLDIDLYVTKALRKQFGIETMGGLYDWYKRSVEDAMAFAATTGGGAAIADPTDGLVKQLTRATFSKEKSHELVDKLAQLAAEEAEMGEVDWEFMLRERRGEMEDKWLAAEGEAMEREKERLKEQRLEQEKLEKERQARQAAEAAERARLEKLRQEKEAKEQAEREAREREEAERKERERVAAMSKEAKILEAGSKMAPETRDWEGRRREAEAMSDAAVDEPSEADVEDEIQPRTDAVGRMGTSTLPERPKNENSLFEANRDRREDASHGEYVAACRQLMEIPVQAFVEQLEQRKVVMSHFGLGDTGALAVSHAMRVNGSIRSIELADNRIFSKGMNAIASFLTENHTLTSLNLADNHAGTSASAIFRALRVNKTLKTLCLKGNHIGDAVALPVRRALAENTTLTALDLSFNQVRDAVALSVAAATAAPTAALKNINLKWNKVSSVGAAALSEALKVNTTVIVLDMSWNSLGEKGGILLGEALATNAKLRKIDLSQNRLTTKAALIIADSLRFNSTLCDIQLNYNPLGEAGGRAIVSALHDAGKTLASWGLTAIETDFVPRLKSTEFDALHPDGHYQLNLSDPWEHAIAEMLRVRAIDAGGKWHNSTLNKKPFAPDTNLGYGWKLPSEGILRLDFVGGKPISSVASDAPSVFFKLDLSRRDEHAIATTLVERALSEPGENWVRETFNGEPFEFDEEEHSHEWIAAQKTGILELEYVASSLAQEAKYEFDLSDPMDHAVAYKMLERVYEVGDKFGDKWENCTLDTLPLDLNTWRRGKVGADGEWISATRLQSKTVKDRWRVPHSGLLSFEMHTKRPMHVFTQHYKLNLAIDTDRRIAHNLRVRASLMYDENWWNERIDGVPFQLKESLAEGDKFFLPRLGILELDYVVCRPVDTAKRMQRDHFKLDLGKPADALMAATIRSRSVNSVFSAVREIPELGHMKYEGRPTAPVERDLRKFEPRQESLEAARKAAEERARRRAPSRGRDGPTKEERRAAKIEAMRKAKKRAAKEKKKAEKRRIKAERRAAKERRRRERAERMAAEAAAAAADADEDGGAAAGAGAAGVGAAPKELKYVPSADDIVKHEEAVEGAAKLRAGMGAIMGGGTGVLFSEDFLSAAGKMLGADVDEAIEKTGGEFRAGGHLHASDSEGDLMGDISDDSEEEGAAGAGAEGPVKGVDSLKFAAGAAGKRDALGRMDKASLLTSQLAELVEPASEEFVINITFEGRPVDMATFMDETYELPAAGILQFDLLWFMSTRAMSAHDHNALVRELRKQSTDKDKLGLLKVVLGGSVDSGFFLTCQMVIALLHEILGWEAKAEALEMMRERVINPHRLVEVETRLHNAETASKVISHFNVADLVATS